MTKYSLQAIAGLIITFTSLCQNTDGSLQNRRTNPIFYLNKPGINKITVTDSVVLSTIKNYIVKIKSEDSLFRKYGYITIMISRTEECADLKPNNLCFRTTTSYYYYYSNYESDRFPLYFTEIDNKPVVFFDYIVQQGDLRTKEKKKFTKLINSFLEPIESAKVITENGEKRKLRPVGRTSLGQGITFCR